MKNTVFKNQLPTLTELKRATQGLNFVIVYDERLFQYKFFQIWLENFKSQFSVRAGEDLKNIDRLPNFLRQFLPAFSGFAPKESVLVSVGGGSVGDFAGFVASVLKRGVGYVHIPSTWLAAVDSAHGAKNALNIDDYKNQIGTFYEAQKVYCVRELLMVQPLDNVRSAYGEVIKMSLLSKPAFFKKIEKINKFDAASLWRLLPEVIEAKYNIVGRDPFEKKGVRHLLNLGHTLGHALELDQLLPHGIAVQKGLEFAVDWSLKLALLKPEDHRKIKYVLGKNALPKIAPIQRSRMQKILQQDKKTISGDRLRFVFIKKPGIALIQEKKIDEIVFAACELGVAE